MRAYVYAIIAIALLVFAPLPLVFGATGPVAVLFFAVPPMFSAAFTLGAYYQWRSDRQRRAQNLHV